jgi:Spy/CpxP family protein refolding chaperone
MNKTKLLFIFSFIMVFAAGAVAGWVIRAAKPPLRGGAWIARELKLTGEQQRQMEGVWNPLREKTREFPSDARRELSEKRDQAVKELLAEDQKKRFEEISADYQQKKEALMKGWRAPMDDAVEKTRKVLSAEQFKKFEELMEKRREFSRGPRLGNHGSSTDNTKKEESSK